MTATLLERPSRRWPPNGGRPARRAVVRWGLRLFRREWRQQLLVLGLLAVSVAATTVGLAVATNATGSPTTTFTLPGSDPQLSADVAAIQDALGRGEVVAHHRVAVPGSVSSIDLRALLAGRSIASGGTVGLLAGRFPSRPGEVSLTPRVATIFDLHVGGVWREGNRDLHVVGLVENRRDLLDQFALVAPGQLDGADTVTVEFDAVIARDKIERLRLPSGTPRQVELESTTARTAAAIAVLALGTIGLLFVGLVGVAGFTVMAQRRRRALGVLGSIGGTERHVRLVMLANGAGVGAAAALAGTAVGVAGWLAFASHLESLAEHRVDRFHLPWWAIAAAGVLAVVTALVASWWPARAASRIPVVAALSGRPPKAQPPGRFAAPGGLVLAAGLLLLAAAHQRRPLVVVAGTVATVLGVLFLAPLAIRATGALASRAPVALRLAVRDLARYQARSGAALGAATLAVGIAAIVAVTVAAQVTRDADTGANLSASELVVYLAPKGSFGLPADIGAADVEAARRRVDGMATSVATRDVVELDEAVNPATPVIGGPKGPGRQVAALVQAVPESGGVSVRLTVPLYVATPELLAQYGIDDRRVETGADVLTSRTDVAGLQLAVGPRGELRAPTVQRLGLPHGSSEPNTLITTTALRRLGLTEVAAAWLIRAPHALTTAQIDAARKTAAAGGLTVETRRSRQSLVRLGHEASVAAILLTLGVLGMSAGLIRSETADDLRILTATGATSRTRRSLTAATTGVLATLAALLGAAEAYLAAIAFYRSNLRVLGHPPAVDLAVIVVGLPLAALTAGWLLAGREPKGIARRPLE
jgi:putative ABC transport system permease protein